MTFKVSDNQYGRRPHCSDS